MSRSSMPSTRALIVTALPLAILLAFAVIGVIASRSKDAASASPTESGSGGMPFASEPVKARWQPPRALVTGATAPASAPESQPQSQPAFAFDIAPPAAAESRSYDMHRDHICLDDRRDVIISRTRLTAPDSGVLVNNESKAERVLIDGLNASDCTEYGMYTDGASDWWVRNSTLHLAKDAMQHGWRIASGERIRMTDSVIDTRLADKTSLWVLRGEDLEFRNVKFLGGRNWFSIDPDNPDLPDGFVRNLIIADCWIDLDQDWAYALEFMPGVENVTITNLHVRSAKPPIGVWKTVGGVAAARNVRWKDIWIPATGQAADKPFDELEWVKLRDDDWDRILGQKGRTREELIKDGIGPLR